MIKSEERFDTSEIQFTIFDNALFGTLFAMSKVCNFLAVPWYTFFSIFFLFRVKKIIVVKIYLHIFQLYLSYFSALACQFRKFTLGQWAL